MFHSRNVHGSQPSPRLWVRCLLFLVIGVFAVLGALRFVAITEPYGIYLLLVGMMFYLWQWSWHRQDG